MGNIPWGKCNFFKGGLEAPSSFTKNNEESIIILYYIILYYIILYYIILYYIILYYIILYYTILYYIILDNKLKPNDAS